MVQENNRSLGLAPRYLAILLAVRNLLRLKTACKGKKKSKPKDVGSVNGCPQGLALGLGGGELPQGGRGGIKQCADRSNIT